MTAKTFADVTNAVTTDTRPSQIRSHHGLGTGFCPQLKTEQKRYRTDVSTTKGVTPENKVITHCRIGERSSHTWFVLKYLLGYPDVRNYDGSWTEWGNLVRTPIETA